MPKISSPTPSKRRVRTTLKKTEVVKLIRELPAMLSGRIPSRFGLHKLFWGAVAYSLFTDIHDAYEAKSFGLPDELGEEWEDLSQHTKAYKRPLDQQIVNRQMQGGGLLPTSIVKRYKKNRPKRMMGKGKFAHDPTRAQTGLGLLSPSEYLRWKKIFGQVYHATKSRLGESEAKVAAGQAAWNQLKREGAQTMWDVLGRRDLLIMRISDRLMASLSPGKFDRNSGYRKFNKDQVYELRRGSVELGTQVPYAADADKKRKLWPDSIDQWIDRAVTFGRDCVLDRIASILQSGT